MKPTPATPLPAPPAGSAPGCPKDIEGPSMVPIVTVEFPERATKIEAELARTPHDIERGLMFRTQMAEDHGMLFRLGERLEHKFWMRNTCIPLDMLFIDDDGLIVGIVENVPTLNEDERTVGCPSSWVLEVNAGWSRRHGVTAGQKLVIPAGARTL